MVTRDWLTRRRIMTGDKTVLDNAYLTLYKSVKNGDFKVIVNDEWNIELQEAQSDYDNGVFVYRCHWEKDACAGTWDYAVVCKEPTSCVRVKYGFHNGAEIYSVLDMDYCNQEGISAGWMGSLFARVLNEEMETKRKVKFKQPIETTHYYRA